MEIILSIVDFVRHIDVHLASVSASVGLWTYVIIFFIIVGETGLVLAPVLPGESLLFASGALAAKDLLHIGVLLPLLWLAAILGDSLNYAFGQMLGFKAFRKDSRFLNLEHLERSQAFFRKHGGPSIILARFLPFVRTCAPFIAGASRMHYPTFLFYNIVGGAIWVFAFVLAGYFFGQIEAVQRNFSLAILAVIGVSVLPVVGGWLKHRFYDRRRAAHRALIHGSDNVESR